MNDDCAPWCVKIFQSIGSLTLGLGTFALALATIIKIPEILEVVSRVHKLDETVIQVRESTNISLDILRKINALMPIAASVISKSNDKEEISIFLHSLYEPTRVGERGERSFSHASSMTSEKKEEIDKVIIKWEKLESKQEKETYLKNIILDQWQDRSENSDEDIYKAR